MRSSAAPCARAGHPVVAVSAISEASRERAATLLPGVPVLDIPEVVRRAELVLLAVPDDALAGLVKGLADVGAWQAGQIVVHTSGTVRRRRPRAGAGGRRDPVGAAPRDDVHGHVARPRRASSAARSRSPRPARCCPIGQALVVEIGGEPVVLDEDARGLYHAALAHGANHLVVLVAQAAQALADAGVTDPGRMLAPLLEAALDGALRAESPTDPVTGSRGTGAISALTGPVRRGDAGTVREHGAALAGFAARTGAVDVVEGYRSLARSAAGRALAAGLISASAAQDVLDGINEGSPTLGNVSPQTDPQEDPE